MFKNCGVNMKKKCTLSTMLSLIVVVITVIAFGGMTVWADPEPASYDLSPDTYTLTNSGYSDIEFTFDSVNYGTVVNGDKTETTNGLALRFYGGTLSCGENQIDFSVSRNDHNSHSNEVYMSFGNYSNNSFTVAVYVNPAAYRSAPAGTYTGTMTYTSTWYTSHTSVSGSSGSVELTLVIPDQNENIFEYGSRGNISWTFDRSGTLTIIGTGAMGDYKRYDAPWDSCADEIKNVIIGNGITSVGKEAFYFYSSLESVSLPDTITSIGEESFYSCKKLASINFPDSVASIATNAFRACEVLELDSLPSGLTSLGDWSFAYCNKITTLTLPASIERFGDSAFENCGNLTTVVLSDGSKVIGKNAFAYSYSLSEVHFEAYTTYMTIDPTAFRSSGANLTIYAPKRSGDHNVLRALQGVVATCEVTYSRWLTVQALNANEEKELTQEYGIRQAPTLVLVNGDRVEKYRGVSDIKGWLMNR